MLLQKLLYISWEILAFVVTLKQHISKSRLLLPLFRIFWFFASWSADRQISFHLPQKMNNCTILCFEKLSNSYCSNNNSPLETPTAHRHTNIHVHSQSSAKAESRVCVCPGSADFIGPGQVNRIGGSSGVCKLQIHPGAAGATAGKRPAETEQM